MLALVGPGDDPLTGGRVLIDPSTLSDDDTITLDGWLPSPDGALLAYLLSDAGDEESSLRVMAVDRGEDVDGPIDRCRYSSLAWTGDPAAGGCPPDERRREPLRNAGLYYVRRLPAGEVPAGEESFHRRVRFHRLGADPADDELVFGDGRDPTAYYSVDVSVDGRWLLLAEHLGTAPRNDVWIADLAAPDGHRRLVPVHEGLDAATYAHVGPDGRLYLHSTLDAPRYRLAVTDPRAAGAGALERPPARGRRRPGRLVPHRRRRRGRPGPPRREPGHGPRPRDRRRPPARSLFPGSAWRRSPAARRAAATCGSGTRTSRPPPRSGTTRRVRAPAFPRYRRAQRRNAACSGRRLRARRTFRPRSPTRSATPQRTGPKCGCSSSTGPTSMPRTGPTRPCCTATAGSVCRRCPPTRPRWRRGWSGAASGSWPASGADPRRARPGTGTACGTASSTASTTSSPPARRSSPPAGRPPSGSASTAAATGASSSAPP